MVVEAVGGTGSLPMDGTEQNLFSLTTQKFLGGYVDLAPMLAGDTIIIREYHTIKSGGAYIQANVQTYSGAQATKALKEFPMKPNFHGYRISLQQTVGSFRTIDFEFFEV